MSELWVICERGDAVPVSAHNTEQEAWAALGRMASEQSHSLIGATVRLISYSGPGIGMVDQRERLRDEIEQAAKRYQDLHDDLAHALGMSVDAHDDELVDKVAALIRVARAELRGKGGAMLDMPGEPDVAQVWTRRTRIGNTSIRWVPPGIPDSETYWIRWSARRSPAAETYWETDDGAYALPWPELMVSHGPVHLQRPAD